jgi:hypothetical protein
MKKIIVLSVLSVVLFPSLLRAGDTECDKGFALVCVSVDDQGQETILTNGKGKTFLVCPAQPEQSIKLACKSKDEVKAAEKAAKAEIAKAKKDKAKTDAKPAEPAPDTKPAPATDKVKIKEAVDAAIAPLKDATPPEAGETKAEIVIDSKPAYDASYKGGYDGASEALKGINLKCPEGSGGKCDTSGLEKKIDDLKTAVDALPKTFDVDGKTIIISAPPEKKTWCARYPGKCAALATVIGLVVVGVTAGSAVGYCTSNYCWEIK